MVNHSINPWIMERRITGTEEVANSAADAASEAATAAATANAALEAIKNVNIFKSVSRLDGREDDPTVFTPTESVIVDKATVFPNTGYSKRCHVIFDFTRVEETSESGGSLYYEQYFKVENLVNSAILEMTADATYSTSNWSNFDCGKAKVELLAFEYKHDTMTFDATYKISFKTKPDSGSAQASLEIIFQN